jgi:hypothetical protein
MVDSVGTNENNDNLLPQSGREFKKQKRQTKEGQRDLSKSDDGGLEAARMTGFRLSHSKI